MRVCPLIEHRVAHLLDVVSEFRDEVSHVAAAASCAEIMSVSDGVYQRSSVWIKVSAGQSTDIRSQLVTSVATDPAFNSQIHSADLNPFPFGGPRQRIWEGQWSADAAGHGGCTVGGH